MPKQEIDLSLLIKLGSIAVHADEMLSPDGREVDKHTIKDLLSQPDVVQWLKDNAVMLPRKRVGKGYDDRGSSGAAVDALVELRKLSSSSWPWMQR